jgi:hypothetical protein
MYDVYAGVNSVAITGEAKDRLEVVGESIDIACLINRLRKKVCRADDIVVVEEAKDNKKEEEEEKKKKEEEAKKKRKVEEDKEAEEEKKKKEEELKEPWAACPPPCSGGYYPGLPQTFLCEENNSQKAATSCEATYYYLRWILPGVYA